VVLLLAAGLIVALLGVAIIRFNLQRRRACVEAASVPRHVVRQIIHLIDSAGAEDGSKVVLLRPDPEASASNSMLSSEPANTQEGTFLAQITLAAPPLSLPWQGRVLSLFAVEAEVQVRSTTIPRQSATTGVPLVPVRLPLPPPAEESPSPYSPRFLCERVTSLRSLLAPYTGAPERVLPYLLVPGIPTFEIDTFAVSLVGGEPELIQSEHDAKCSTCGLRMRFLLSSGAFSETLGGDAPVVYVYGCDEHVENVRAFVDTSRRAQYGSASR
jgi:hypothetical protein